MPLCHHQPGLKDFGFRSSGHPGHSCECKISKMTGGVFFTLHTNVHTDSRMNWIFEIICQISRSLHLSDLMQTLNFHLKKSCVSLFPILWYRLYNKKWTHCIVCLGLKMWLIFFKQNFHLTSFNLFNTYHLVLKF